MEKTIKTKREKVASIIQQARLKQGLTQEGLANKVGFSRNTIARIENCRFSPNADQLYKILEILDLTIKINKEDI